MKRSELGSIKNVRDRENMTENFLIFLCSYTENRAHSTSSREYSHARVREVTNEIEWQTWKFEGVNIFCTKTKIS